MPSLFFAWHPRKRPISHVVVAVPDLTILKLCRRDGATVPAYVW